MRMTLLLSLALMFAACSSKPKQAPMDQLTGSGDNDLELNGSSDNGRAGGLRSIYFGNDSSTLNASSKNDLKENADFLKSHTNVSVEIEGHCDERGGRQYNLSLGERRAKTTREYLAAMGVSKKQMTTISYGNERPVTEGHSEAQWSKNRRANFSITAK